MNPDGTFGDVPTAADFFAGIVSAPPRPPDDVLEAVHCLVRLNDEEERIITGWRERDLACVREWLAGGGDPNIHVARPFFRHPGSLVGSVLSSAVYNATYQHVDTDQQIAVLDLLYAAGADLEKRDPGIPNVPSGVIPSPLQGAASARVGSFRLTKWLLDRGVSVLDRDGADAIRWASGNANCLTTGENVDVVRLLLNHPQHRASSSPGLREAETSAAQFGHRAHPLIRWHRRAPHLMKDVMVLRTLCERGRAVPPKIPRRPRRCHELQVLLARLFGPNMPKPLFRIIVEFWLGRGLPYKYSRDYLPEPEGDFPSQPGNDIARNYIREGL